MLTPWISYDRAGYYICWGCLVWNTFIVCVTGVVYLFIKPAVHLGCDEIFTIVLAGLTIWLIMIRSSSDKRGEQKATCSCGANHDDQGEVQTIEGDKASLFASGWWSISRHFATCLKLPLVVLDDAVWFR